MPNDNNETIFPPQATPFSSPQPAPVPGRLAGNPGLMVDRGESVIGFHAGVISAQRVAVPRDDAKVIAKMKILAATAGDSFYYRWPVKNRKTGKVDYVEGPSIKLANDLARVYGNCQIDVIAEDHGQFWLIYARFVDIETGFSMTRAFQQRKSQRIFSEEKSGQDTDRELDIAFQIGQSKAIRNVIVNALQTYADYAFEEAKKSLIDHIAAKPEAAREKIAGWAQRLAIPMRNIENQVGRAIKEWTVHDLARVGASLRSIEDNMVYGPDLFPDPADAATAGDGARPKKTDFKKDGDPKKTAGKKEAKTDAKDQAQAAGDTQGEGDGAAQAQGEDDGGSQEPAGTEPTATEAGDAQPLTFEAVNFDGECILATGSAAEFVKAVLTLLAAADNTDMLDGIYEVNSPQFNVLDQLDKDTLRTAYNKKLEDLTKKRRK